MNILHVMYLYNQIKATSGAWISIRELLSSVQRQQPDISTCKD